MLQVRGLEKIIENRTALSIEQLDLQEGEVLTVVGPIGSMKTLLVQLLCGMAAPSGGKVLLDGKDIHHSEEARKSIGVLFEEDLLYERLSARENLEFYGRLNRIPPGRVAEMLAKVGLNDQARKAANKLSIVSQRRLAFARALMGQPSLLLLDRPILRTDLDTQTLFANLIREATAKGAAVLITDEDLAWSGKFSTHILELEDGRVVGSRLREQEAESSAPPEPSTPSAPTVLTVPARISSYKIPARKEDRITLYDPGELLYATSREGKTYLHTLNEEATTNLTLQELEMRLAGRGFFKAHRAYLVNLQHIKAVIQYTRNSYTLQLNDPLETMIPLSKQSEKELSELLGY
jgi:ABC-2 type transport system ATP-binding protein